MASYLPPSENLPVFDNSVFEATNGSPTGAGTGNLTLAQANLLYLRKNYADLCTQLETFNAGISTTFLTSSGNITGPIVTNSITSLTDTTTNVFNNLTTGVLNIATNARTGNVNFGTSQAGGYFTMGNNANTQTSIYGGTVALLNNSSVTGSLYVSNGLSSTSYDGLTSGSNVGIGSGQVTGTLNIGTSGARLGNINIGTGASSTNNIYIGTSTTPTTIYGSLTTNSISNASNSITGTYGSITQSLNNYTIKGTYNLNLDQTSTFGSIVIGATNGNFSLGKSGVSANIQGNLNFNNNGTITSISSISSRAVQDMGIADIQTTGTLNIGTGARVGPDGVINIGTNGSSNPMNIGTTGMPIACRGTWNFYDTAQFISGLASSSGTIISTLFDTISTTASLSIGALQTSGVLNIGTGSTRTSYINIGGSGGATIRLNSTIDAGTNGIANVGAINSSGGIVGTNMTVNTGTFRGDNLNGSAPSVAMVIAGDQTLGVLNIAGNSARSGNINIGVNATGGTITIGNASTSVSIPNLSITTATLNTPTPTLAVDLYGNQTSGVLNIGNSSSRTGNINIGTNSTSTAVVRLGSTTSIVSVLNQLTVAGSFSCNSFSTATVYCTSVDTNTPTLDVSIFPSQTSGIINIGTNSSRTGNINIGTNATGGTVSIGSTSVPVTIGSSITLGVPPTLTSSSMGYYQNYPVVNFTGVTTTGYKFSPTSNTAGAFNFFKAGIYHATMDFTIRYTGSPTLASYIYNIGFSSGTTTGTVTTSTVSTIGSLTQDTRGALQSTTGNNIDFSKSYSACFTLSSDSFVNLTININTITITGGTLSIFCTGTIHRIA